MKYLSFGGGYVVKVCFLWAMWKYSPNNSLRYLNDFIFDLSVFCGG